MSGIKLNVDVTTLFSRYLVHPQTFCSLPLKITCWPRFAIITAQTELAAEDFRNGRIQNLG